MAKVLEKLKSLLRRPKTAEYTPTATMMIWGTMHSMPRFSLRVISSMLTDPRIAFGLWLIKGPILSKARFYIDCDNSAAKEFIKKNLIHFWRGSASRALKSLEWGYSCSENIYRLEDGNVYFDSLKDLYPPDCKLLTLDGQIAGSRVRNVPIKGGGKAVVDLSQQRTFWHIHSRDYHPYYGRSRLFGAYLPWLEAWSEGGYRDSRRLFFHKYAFQGPTIYHPVGNTRTDLPSSGPALTETYKDIAREMGEKARAGAAMIFPNVVDSNGQRLWQIDPPFSVGAPVGLMDYGTVLKDEVWEGMGIPPEVARAEGTGAYAGRKIPMEAFFSILQEIVFWLSHDFSSQVIRPLVDSHFSNINYEIIPFELGIPKTGSEEEQPQPGEEEGQQLSLGTNTVNLVSNEPPPDYQPSNEATIYPSSVALAFDPDKHIRLPAGSKPLKLKSGKTAVPGQFIDKKDLTPEDRAKLESSTKKGPDRNTLQNNELKAAKELSSRKGLAEKAYVLDAKTGRQEAEVEGNLQRIGIPSQHFENRNGVVVIHSHPTPVSFSAADWQLFGYQQNLQRFTAETSEGSYILEKKPGADRIFKSKELRAERELPHVIMDRELDRLRDSDELKALNSSLFQKGVSMEERVDILSAWQYHEANKIVADIYSDAVIYRKVDNDDNNRRFQDSGITGTTGKEADSPG